MSLAAAARFVFGASVAAAVVWSSHGSPLAQQAPAAVAPTFTRDIAPIISARCAPCHRDGGAASEITGLPMLKDPDWLLSHVRDPQMIAPGLREPPSGAMIIRVWFSDPMMLSKGGESGPPFMTG